MKRIQKKKKEEKKRKGKLWRTQGARRDHKVSSELIMIWHDNIIEERNKRQ